MDISSKVQSLLFDRAKWTEEEAKDWASEHGYRYGTVEKGPEELHVVQEDPRDVPAGSRYRTIPFGRRTGIQARVFWEGIDLEELEDLADDVGDALDEIDR